MVPLSGQALWREKQESGKAWVKRHGKRDEFCTEEGVVTGKWPGWFVWWWWRGQRIWDLTSCRAGAYRFSALTARPSVQVGRQELRIFEGLLSSCTCALPAVVYGERRPRLSRSLGTSSRWKGQRMVPWTRAIEEASNSVLCTRLSLGTGSKSSGGHGRRFGRSVQPPGSSSPSARSTGGSILTTGLRSQLGDWVDLWWSLLLGVARVDWKRATEEFAWWKWHSPSSPARTLSHPWPYWATRSDPSATRECRWLRGGQCPEMCTQSE